MAEEDYKDWKERLEIVQTSMNSLKSITLLSNYVKNKFGKLDYLINNAAQTIRRPRAFYTPLKKPTSDPDKLVKLVIDDYFKFNNDKVDLAVEYEDIKKFVQENPQENQKKEILTIREEKNEDEESQ